MIISNTSASAAAYHRFARTLVQLAQAICIFRQPDFIRQVARFTMRNDDGEVDGSIFHFEKFVFVSWNKRDKYLKKNEKI